MKNKPLFFKIITIITVFTVIFSVICISSSAYTFYNPSAYNNSEQQFTLPMAQILLENESNETDIPGYFYIPMVDYYGRVNGQNVVTVDCIIGGRNTNLRCYQDTSPTNVYSNNGYLKTASVSLSSGVDITNLYQLSGFLYEDWWILGNSTDSIYNSVTFNLTYPKLLQQTIGNYYIIESLPIKLTYNYYDLDGNYNTDIVYTRLVPIKADGVDYVPSEGVVDYTTYTFELRYFESTPLLYDLTDNFPNITDYYQYKDVYFYTDMAYIDSLHINFIGDYGTGFLQGSSNNLLSGTYTNRLAVPNYSTDTLDTIVENVTSNNYSDGYDTGYDAGNTAGYNTGYDAGYLAGISQGGSSTLNPFDSVISAVGTFLDWEFIDGISMAGLLSVVLGVCLVLTFLKIFAGG